ncbi:MAG: hypothetical protein M3O62_14995 [Pseudomonadota bacterium]|nr:hypothetical protein [Pseudomonadota bacterium]
MRFVLPILSILLSMPAASQSPPAGPCSSSEHRQFDFWLGNWQVRKPDGGIAGINRIESEYGGCVMHERYTTGRGYRGESLNIYDASRKLWHQTWVDNSGLLLILEGSFNGKSMVLEGQTAGDAQPTKHRITWTPNPDGTVRQLWESTDEKGSWAVAFDGLYSKR